MCKMTEIFGLIGVFFQDGGNVMINTHSEFIFGLTLTIEKSIK